jgi:hypothetical protein
LLLGGWPQAFRRRGDALDPADPYLHGALGPADTRPCVRIGHDLRHRTRRGCVLPIFSYVPGRFVMLTTGFIVGVLLVGWGVKAKRVKSGSLTAGVLLGLILMGTPAGPPLARAVQTSADAIGRGAVAAFHAVAGR